MIHVLAALGRTMLVQMHAKLEHYEMSPPWLYNIAAVLVLLDIQTLRLSNKNHITMTREIS